MQLVTVATFSQSPEAYLAKNLLEAEGLQAFIADEHTASWQLPVIPGGEVKVQVAEDQAARAAEILRAAKGQ